MSKPLEEERDKAYVRWQNKSKSMHLHGQVSAGDPTHREVWDAAWESAMDLAAICVQLIDADMKAKNCIDL